nr:hypothetical protein [Tanacetum cinerariifolium]
EVLGFVAKLLDRLEVMCFAAILGLLDVRDAHLRAKHEAGRGINRGFGTNQGETLGRRRGVADGELRGALTGEA